VLSDFQVSVPELGTVRAKHIPLVVLTSNNARELSDGLKRRLPAPLHRLPGAGGRAADHPTEGAGDPDQLARAVVAAVQKIRAMDLRKLPSVSESLDWARSLVILNARELDPGIVESTLTMLVKHEKDLERVKGSLDRCWRSRSWTRESSSSSATSAGPRSASRPRRRSTPPPSRRAPRRRALRRETFKRRLAATLIKGSAISRPSIALFNLYFLDLEALGEGLKKALSRGPRSRTCSTSSWPTRAMELDELTELLMRGQGSELEMAIRSGGRTPARAGSCTSAVGFFSRRISDRFDWSPSRVISRRIMKRSKRAVSIRASSRASGTTSSSGSSVQAHDRQHVERELERRAYRQGEKLTREVLSDKPLFALTPTRSPR